MAASDALIQLSNGAVLDPERLDIRGVRASGPGGQHVNKTSSAIELRYDLKSAPLDGASLHRLARLAGSRLSQDGVLLIVAQRFRSQELNRQDAIARLAEMIEKALVAPRTRRPTRATLASKTRRLEGKGRRSTTKALRGRPRMD